MPNEKHARVLFKVLLIPWLYGPWRYYLLTLPHLRVYIKTKDYFSEFSDTDNSDLPVFLSCPYCIPPSVRFTIHLERLERARKIYTPISMSGKEMGLQPQILQANTARRQASKYMALNLLRDHLQLERFLKAIDDHDQQAKKHWGFGRKSIDVEGANTVKNEAEKAIHEFKVRDFSLYIYITSSSCNNTLNYHL